MGYGAAGRWVLRTSGDSDRLEPAMRQAVKEIDPLLAIAEVQPMSVLVDRAWSRRWRCGKSRIPRTSSAGYAMLSHRSFRTCRILALSVFWLGAARLHGQGSSKPVTPQPVNPVIAQPLLLQLMVTLRELITAEEAYYAEHGQYSRTVGAAASQVQLSVPERVSVTLVYASRNAWGARVTHAQLPGRSCVVFMGPPPKSIALRMTAQRLVAREEGIVTCDRP